MKSRGSFVSLFLFLVVYHFVILKHSENNTLKDKIEKTVKRLMNEKIDLNNLIVLADKSC